jgi:FkbM family methyltransferase
VAHLDVQIGYDEAWHHRIGSYFVPDGPRFEYYEPTVLSWKNEIAAYFEDAADCWFTYYGPRAGDTIVDVGAGRGEHVLPFSSKVGPTGKVLAIEAHPETYAYLRRFCKLNQLGNVLPIHTALMDTPGKVQIQSVEWYSNTVQSGGSGTEVEATTLDQLCESLHIERIDFLKMNIEGAERGALLGAKECIRRVQQICVCCHDFRADRGHGEQYRTRDFTVDFLKSHGFSLSFRNSDPRDFVRDHIYGARSEPVMQQNLVGRLSLNE